MLELGCYDKHNGKRDHSKRARHQDRKAGRSGSNGRNDRRGACGIWEAWRSIRRSRSCRRTDCGSAQCHREEGSGGAVGSEEESGQDECVQEEGGKEMSGGRTASFVWLMAGVVLGIALVTIWQNVQGDYMKGMAARIYNVSTLLWMIATIPPFWRIFRRLGFAPWLALLAWVPFVSTAILYFAAYSGGVVTKKI